MLDCVSGRFHTMPQPEPWLRGPLAGVSPLVANLIYTFTQAREELEAAVEGLSVEEIWLRPHGLASLGFHIRHLGGAAERLGCYLRGNLLTAEQLSDLKREAEPGMDGAGLMAEMSTRLERLEQDVRAMDPATLEGAREVGRGRLPSTAIGLIVHIAEHTQRHLGQAITTVKLLRSLRGNAGSTSPGR